MKYGSFIIMTLALFLFSSPAEARHHHRHVYRHHHGHHYHHRIAHRRRAKDPDIKLPVLDPVPLPNMGMASAAKAMLSVPAKIVGDLLSAAITTPKRILGEIRIAGESFRFGSGGSGYSIPYGDYRVTPDAVGHWGARHGAVGIANGEIWDKRLHRYREGIELHRDFSRGDFRTEGCIAVANWPRFKRLLMAEVRLSRKVMLHVGPEGAEIRSDRPSPQPAMQIIEVKALAAPPVLIGPPFLHKAAYRRVSQEGSHILPHPPGCPHTDFCGCGAALKVFGHQVRSLWLAANWLGFPRAKAAPGMAVVFGQHHVAVIEKVYGDGTALLYDPNSGGHLTRLHRRSIDGATVVDPHGARHRHALHRRHYRRNIDMAMNYSAPVYRDEW